MTNIFYQICTAAAVCCVGFYCFHL